MVDNDESCVGWGLAPAASAGTMRLEGGVQSKVIDMLVSKVDWEGNGKVLDVGCGGGMLAVKLANYLGLSKGGS